MYTNLLRLSRILYCVPVYHTEYGKECNVKKLYFVCISAMLMVLLSMAAQAGPLGFDKSEYAARRARLIVQIPDGIAVIWGSLAGPQNNDFNYLCGVKVPKAILIIDGMRKESILFYTTSEYSLKGEGLSVELARDPIAATGIEKYYRANQFTTILSQLAEQTSVIYTPFRAEEMFQEVSISSGEWDGRATRELQFVKLLKERFQNVEVRDCSEIIWDLRRIKTPAEIEVLRKAGQIGVQAMIDVIKAARTDQYEYELSSLFEYACKREGCRKVFDYDVIISSAENHPYLHYAQHNRKLVDGDFIVFDSGSDFQDYDVDITVSFPINGKFSPRQREIYEACNEVSKACLSLYKPGITGYQIGEKVREILSQKGSDLTKDAFTRLSFFKEGGITHYVGLATHDAGGRDLPPNQPLKPGQVFASDVYAVFASENLGVRVENTVLITETGCENLTPGLPREISEIEALMKKNTVIK
jgi:Xaa-Pro aminopeptidase